MCHQNITVTAECKHWPLHGVNLTPEPIRCKKFCKQALAAHMKHFGYCNSKMSDDGRKLKYHPNEEKWLRLYGSRHSCTEKRDRSGNLILERKLNQITGPCKKCIAPARTPVPKEPSRSDFVPADRVAQQPLQYTKSSRVMPSDNGTMVTSSQATHEFDHDRGVHGKSSTSRQELFPEDSISNVSTSRCRSEAFGSSYQTPPRDPVSLQTPKRSRNDHNVRILGSSCQSGQSRRDPQQSIDSGSSRSCRGSGSSSRYSSDEPKSHSTRHVHSSRTSADSLDTSTCRHREKACSMRPNP